MMFTLFSLKLPMCNFCLLLFIYLFMFDIYLDWLLDHLELLFWMCFWWCWALLLAFPGLCLLEGENHVQP